MPQVFQLPLLALAPQSPLVATFSKSIYSCKSLGLNHPPFKKKIRCCFCPRLLLIWASLGSLAKVIFSLHSIPEWADNQQFLAHLVLLKRVSSLQELNVGPLDHESNWPTAKPTLTAHHSVYTGCASDTEIYLSKITTTISYFMSFKGNDGFSLV